MILLGTLLGLLQVYLKGYFTALGWCGRLEANDFDACLKSSTLRDILLISLCS